MSATTNLQETLIPRSSGSKDKVAASIPHGWHIKQLQELVRRDSPVGYGIVQPGPNIVGGVPVLAIKNLNEGEWAAVHRSSRQVEAAYRRSRIRAGDVLLSVKGTTGRVGLVPAGFAGNISRDLARLRFTEEHEPAFWYQMLQSASAQRSLQMAAVGTTRQELSIGILKEVEFAHPSKPDQRAIVTALGDADRLIGALRKLVSKKQAIRQGMMQQLLSGETRLPGFARDWHVVPLGDVSQIKTGSRNNQDKKLSGQYPFFVRSATVERIDSYSYDCEAILIPGEGGIGSIFHYINGKFEVHQRVYKISNFTSEADGRFVYYYMRQFFGRHAMENSVKATVDSLRLPTFQSFSMSIPTDLVEQEAIVKVLDDVVSEIEVLEQRLLKARAVKTGMMQELLTGRIRLPVAEAEA
jgi:type I restriction enzyme, S subunit